MIRLNKIVPVILLFLWSIVPAFSQITDTSIIDFKAPVYLAEPPKDVIINGKWMDYEVYNYPPEAIYYQIQGDVYVQFGIDPEGKPFDLQILASPGFGLGLWAKSVMMNYPVRWNWSIIPDSLENEVLRNAEAQHDIQQEKILYNIRNKYFNSTPSGNMPDLMNNTDLNTIKRELHLNYHDHIRIINRNGIVINSTLPEEINYSLFSLGPRNKQMILKAFDSKGYQKGELSFDTKKAQYMKGAYLVLADSNFLLWGTGTVEKSQNDYLVIHPFEHRFVVKFEFMGAGETGNSWSGPNDSLPKKEHTLLNEFVQKVPARKRKIRESPEPLCGEKNWKLRWKKYCQDHNIRYQKGKSPGVVHVRFYINMYGEPEKIVVITDSNEQFSQSVTDFIQENSCGWSIPRNNNYDSWFQLVDYKLKVPRK